MKGFRLILLIGFIVQLVHGWCLRTIFASSNKIRSVDFSPDGEYIITGSSTGKVLLWKTDTLEILKTYVFPVQVWEAVFSKDQQLIAIGGAQNVIHIINASTFAQIRTIDTQHDNLVYDLDFKYDNTMLMTCGQDGKTKIWRVSDGVNNLTKTNKHEAYTCQYGDDHTFAVAGRHYYETFNTAGTLVHQFHDGGYGDFYGLRVRPGGGYFVATNGNGNLFESSWAGVNTFHTDGTGGLFACAYSRDSTYFAAGGQDGNIYLYNATNRVNILQSILNTNSTSSINSSQFSYDSNYLIAGDENGSIYFYQRFCHGCPTGSYPNKTKCIQCSEALVGCAVCINSTICHSCIYGYYIDSATSLCASCDIIQGCANCNSSTNCSSCLQGWYLNGLTCAKCTLIEGCLQCIGANQCVECLSQYAVSGGICVMCSNVVPNCILCSGLLCIQCAAGYAEVSGVCTKCQDVIPNCKICQNSTYCQSCQTGYRVNSTSLCQKCSPQCLFCNNTGHCFDCIQQMYLTSTFTCDFCVPPCTTCNTSTYCLSCISGYYLSAAGVCTNCPAGCLACNTTSYCHACDLGYYLDTATDTCKRCSLLTSNCRQCNSTNCLVCQLEYHIVGSVCSECNSLIDHCAICSNQTVCDHCVNGYYATGLTGTSSSCAACQTGCLNCKSSTECFACKPGYYISGQDCLLCANNCLACTSSASTTCTSCIQGYYLSTTTTGSCLACSVISKCNACLNASYCVGCAVGFFLSSPTLCAACSFPCTTCNTSASDCLTCSLGYYRLLTGAVGSCAQCNYGCSQCSTSASICLSCIQGFYYDPANQCLKCSASLPGCSACQNSTLCLICYNGYSSNSGSCQLCSVSIPQCLSCNPAGSSCYLCEYGYALSATNTTCISCSTSIPYCQNCLTTASCESCTAGFYPNGANCLPCTTGCLNCLNATVCQVCVNGYTLLSTKVCQLCQDAMVGCQRCTSNTVCTDCIVGYYFNASVCYLCRTALQGCTHCSDSTHCLQCDVFYQLQTNSTCKLCSSLYPGCQICPNATTGCTECQTGYYLSTAGTCISCSLGTSQGCLKCSTNITCQQCMSGYYMNSSSLCSTCDFSFTNCIFCNTTQCLLCESGYYLNMGVCTNCSLLGCQICDQNDPLKCVGCNSRYYLLVDQCLLCSVSIPQCLQCENSLACTECASGYYITSTNKCGLCSATFAGCEICSPSGCIDCKSNFFLNTTDLRCHVCTDFIVGCSFCLSEVNCISCQDGYYLLNYTCIHCSNIVGCLYCINQTICTKCQESYYLDSTNNSCLSCSDVLPGCRACDSATNCIACQGHFQLLGGQCAQIKAEVVKRYESIGIKSIYLNETHLKHILFTRQFNFTQVDQDWPSQAELTLIDMDYNRITLNIIKVEWGQKPTQLIFYTDNPIADKLKDSIKGMPFMKQSRRLLMSTDLGFHLRFKLSEQTTHQIMPKLSHFGDLYLDYPYSDPQFYQSYIKNLNFSYHIFGLIITILLLLSFSIKICCFVSQTDDRGSIIPHIFSLKCGALALYPTYAQYVNYCYGFMTADLPWFNQDIGTKLGSPNDHKPDPYTLYYVNLSLVSTYFIAFLVVSFLWISLIFIQYAFEDSKKKIQHIRSLLYNFFSLGVIISGSLCLQGVILNPLDSVSANTVFYVIGIVMYLGSAVEIVYSWSLRRNSALVKLKTNEQDDIGFGGHLRKLRIFIKATLLSLMHFGPLYFLAAIFCIDSAAILLEYYLAREQKVNPKIEAVEHGIVNLAFLLLVIVPDALVGLLIASLLIIISISVAVYRAVCEYQQSASLQSLDIDGGNNFYSNTTENDFLSMQKKNGASSSKDRYAKKRGKQASASKLSKQLNSHQVSVVTTNRVENIHQKNHY